MVAPSVAGKGAADPDDDDDDDDEGAGASDGSPVESGAELAVELGSDGPDPPPRGIREQLARRAIVTAEPSAAATARLDVARPGIVRRVLN
jgi:hypothetical protein